MPRPSVSRHRVSVATAIAAIALAIPAIAGAQSSSHFHHLPARPETVAWGYYSATAKPVLRVASGDTVEVE
ncbi:MAG: hypothetical protein IRY91_08830, partial [Gemmatimonadaceae bacterium]|nr:hypothetical protein [Gemmatimonadaceae bacterium]